MLLTDTLPTDILFIAHVTLAAVACGGGNAASIQTQVGEVFAHVNGVVHRHRACTQQTNISQQSALLSSTIRSKDQLTYMLVGQRSSSIAPKAPTIPSIATDASISVTIRSTGELESIVEPVSVSAREVSVGVAIRRPVSLGDTHNAQTPELLYKRNTDHTEPVSGCILL